MMCIRLTIDHLLNPTTEYWLANYMLTSVSSGLRHVSRMHMATEWMIFFFNRLSKIPKHTCSNSVLFLTEQQDQTIFHYVKKNI